MTADEGVLRIGIAGLGQAGSVLIPAVLRNPRVQVAAVADPNADAVAAFARDFGSTAYEHLEALCGDDKVALVYIATPTHLHTAHALLALAAGKHVIVEKPMAVTLEDATAMIEAAERAGRYLIVGHSQSFEPPVRAMRDLVRSGELGPLRMLHTWSYTDWLYRPRLPAELDPAQGGGALFRQGAHQVDILRWIAGGIVRSVRAAVGPDNPVRGGKGNHTLFLDFEDGVAATAVYSGQDHFQTAELVGITEDGTRWDEKSTYARARSALALPADERARKESLAYGRQDRRGYVQRSESGVRTGRVRLRTRRFKTVGATLSLSALEMELRSEEDSIVEVFRPETIDSISWNSMSMRLRAAGKERTVLFGVSGSLAFDTMGAVQSVKAYCAEWRGEISEWLNQGRETARGSSASVFGLTVVTCERGDIRQTPAGLAVYGDEARSEVAIPPLPDGRDILLAEAYDAVVQGKAPAHDGRWGRANIEVCLAAAESSRTRREIALRFQVPIAD